MVEIYIIDLLMLLHMYMEDIGVHRNLKLLSHKNAQRDFSVLIIYFDCTL